jgi:hypothetical protein
VPYNRGIGQQEEWLGDERPEGRYSEPKDSPSEDGRRRCDRIMHRRGLLLSGQ